LSQPIFRRCVTHWQMRTRVLWSLKNRRSIRV